MVVPTMRANHRHCKKSKINAVEIKYCLVMVWTRNKNESRKNFKESYGGKIKRTRRRGTSRKTWEVRIK